MPQQDMQQHAKLEGTYLPLMRKDTGEVTDEPRFGIKTPSGDYYALDFAQIQTRAALKDLKTGNQINVEGTLVPIEYISSNAWDAFDIRGIISVTTFTRGPAD